MRTEEEHIRNLGGLYTGLHGEIVLGDAYRLNQLPHNFIPDVIFDVGANVGVFSRAARFRFPFAAIVALEPNPTSAQHFLEFFDGHSNVYLVEKALGVGQVFHARGQNLAMENYLTPCLGYGPMTEGTQWERVAVPSISLVDFVRPCWVSGMKSFMKIDCEGGENSIWQEDASMHILSEMDYITMELHFFAWTGAEQKEVNDVSNAAIERLSQTHRVERDGVYLFAKKR